MKVSLITPTIDRSIFLDEAIASVQRQSYRTIEHIVVHDGSDTFMRSFAAKYAQLKILRGPGRGPTAAVAAGIAAATGDFIFYLSSDDRLGPDILERLHKSAVARPEIRIWTGGTRLFRVDQVGREITLRMIISPTATAASLSNLMDDLTLFTARFVHRSVYETLGNMNLEFPESSDREFFLRAALAGVNEAPLGTIASELRQHAESHTMHGLRGTVPPYLSEHLRIADCWLSRNLPPATTRQFRNWRAREVLRMIYYELRANRLAEARATAVAAVAADPLWLLRATSSLGAWLRRRRS